MSGQQKDNKDISILVVDDEDSLRGVIVSHLELEDFQVYGAHDGQEAIDIVQKRHIDFVLSDIRMPNIDGMGLVEMIRKYNPDLPIVVLMTGFSEYDRDEVIKAGASDMISKPFEIDHVVQMIQKAVNS